MRLLGYIVTARDTVLQRCLDAAPISTDQAITPLWARMSTRMYRPIQLHVIRGLGK